MKKLATDEEKKCVAVIITQGYNYISVIITMGDGWSTGIQLASRKMMVSLMN